jgi:sugar lactone lactonase YvrE
MRAFTRWLAVLAVILGSWAAPLGLAVAANLDSTADRVFGQPDFAQSMANNPSLGGAVLWEPSSLLTDGQGNLYVADSANNRVLVYHAPLSTHQAASVVLGQPDAQHNNANYGGLSASGLFNPGGLALDAQGDLFVADTGNNRVLEFDAPLTTHQAASRVLGQLGFNASTPSLGQTGLVGPTGLVLDARGNLYIADSSNNRILEYNAPLVTHQAAQLVFGQPDFNSNTPNNGGISDHSLSLPLGLALDTSGNLYAVDANVSRVLEYDAPLTHDTNADHVLGQTDLQSGFHNSGGLSEHSLDEPAWVALDSQNNVYVADAGNNRVLEFDTPLTHDANADHVFGQPDFIHNAANNGGIGAGTLDVPRGVALDPQGNLYVSDTFNNRVLEYDLPVPHGVPGLDAISPATVAAGSPAFTLTVTGVGFVPGSVVRWNGSNRPTTFLSGTQLNAAIPAADVAVGGPFAVTVFTPSPGGGTSNLRNLSLYARLGHDTSADLELGQPSFTDNTFFNPALLSSSRLRSANGLALDQHSGRLFVADAGDHRVLSWPNAAGQVNGQPADLVLGQANFLATGPALVLSAHSLADPQDLALDAQGDLFVADSSNNRVLEYLAPLSSGMAASRVFGQPDFSHNTANNGGRTARSLDEPFGVAVDAHGNLYVADELNQRVLEYNAPLSSGMAASRVFGQGGSFTTGLANNGGVSANSLDVPAGLALDSHGNLYTVDFENNRVLEYDTPLSTDTTADRVFGQPDFAGHNGGLGNSALAGPLGVALDRLDNLYVDDGDNNRVLEFDAPLAGDRVADRVFGQPGFGTATPNNGGVSAHSLNFPFSVAVDASNNLYIADEANGRILEFDWARTRLALPLLIR